MLAVALSACSTASAKRQGPELVPASRPARQDDAFFGTDKVKHFFIAGFVETMAFAGAQAAGSARSAARPVAIGTVTAVSLGRELYDLRKKGLFSVRDLAWDALGAGAALLVVNKTQR